MASDDSDLFNVAMLIDELKVSVKSTQSAFNVHRTGRTDTFPVAMKGENLRYCLAVSEFERCL